MMNATEFSGGCYWRYPHNVWIRIEEDGMFAVEGQGSKLTFNNFAASEAQAMYRVDSATPHCNRTRRAIIRILSEQSYNNYLIERIKREVPVENESPAK